MSIHSIHIQIGQTSPRIPRVCVSTLRWDSNYILPSVRQPPPQLFNASVGTSSLRQHFLRIKNICESIKRIRSISDHLTRSAISRSPSHIYGDHHLLWVLQQHFPVTMSIQDFHLIIRILIVMFHGDSHSIVGFNMIVIDFRQQPSP